MIKKRNKETNPLPSQVTLNNYLVSITLKDNKVRSYFAWGENKNSRDLRHLESLKVQILDLNVGGPCTFQLVVQKIRSVV